MRNIAQYMRKSNSALDHKVNGYLTDPDNENNVRSVVTMNPKSRDPLPVDPNKFLYAYLLKATEVVRGDGHDHYDLGNETTKQRLRELVLSFNTGNYCNKFIIVAGIHGSGKSTVMKVLSQILYGRSQGFRFLETNKLMDEVRSGSYKAIEYLETGGLCLNDYGWNDRSVKHYGDEIDAIGKLVYNRWEIYNRATYFTTNLMTKELFLNQFTAQVRDRIENNMMHIPLNEKNHRKIK